jgi:hypothetical protein
VAVLPAPQLPLISIRSQSYRAPFVLSLLSLQNGRNLGTCLLRTQIQGRCDWDHSNPIQLP